MEDTEQYMLASDAARFLNISRSWVLKLTKEMEIPYFIRTVRGVFVYRASDIRKFKVVRDARRKRTAERVRARREARAKRQAEWKANHPEWEAKKRAAAGGE